MVAPSNKKKTSRNPAPSRAIEPPEADSGRIRLLRAAIRLFGEKGYAATSVRDIVQAAGVTAPTLYHHFGNKEGIYLAIARTGRERIQTTWREALEDGGSVSERIRRLSRVQLEVQRKAADLAWAVERIMSDPMEGAPSSEFRALALERVRQFENLVREGVDGREFQKCHPRHVALLIMGAIGTASRLYLGEVSAESPEERLEGMLGVILQGIGRRDRKRR